jgi:hypothetical protein
MTTDTISKEVREAEEDLIENTDPEALAEENAETEEDIEALTDGVPKKTPFAGVLNALPTTETGILEPEFWRYYRRPWTPIFYEYDDPFNDLVSIEWGPRGGGKTISAVSKGIIDGQMRGIPCVSNVPFAWVAKDLFGNLWKIESIPFDQEKFAYGDESLKYKRLLIDEGNYLADRLRSTSNKNLAMSDILQQARKFRMCVDFCTINWMWLDPRVTGSLCDILIECNDLYYKQYGRKKGIKKGHRIAWDIKDQSGKISGRQFSHLASTTFNARALWHTYNTENFVSPIEARKRLKAQEKTVVDQFGNEISMSEWHKQLHAQLLNLSQAQPRWSAFDLWNALGITEPGLKVKAGQYMRGQLGIEKFQQGNGSMNYDLSTILF